VLKNIIYEQGGLSMKFARGFLSIVAIVVSLSFLHFPVQAQDTGSSQDSMSFLQRLKRFKEIRKTQKENEAAIVSEESLGAHRENIFKDAYGGRDIILYVPSHLPEKGRRSMIVALHGGMGNAQFMQEHLKMDGVAEKYGFIVAYLNGSLAARRLSDKFHVWNAGGGCCGKPYTDKVDDIGYITEAIHYLEKKYGVDSSRVFGIGHSNGAIMTQTLMCETDLYRKAISLAGSLMAEVDRCPAAQGKEILAIHGKNDLNVPPEGGKGTKGVTNISYRSEADSQAAFRNSGGTYNILWVDSDHSLEHLAAAIQKSEGVSLAEKEARFFGLSQQSR
jgi:poly(3-hydroxybutyrate) depolymerase